MVDVLYWLVISVGVLGTILGAAIGVIRKPSQKMMCWLFAFAAGIMLAVSFLELLPEAVVESGLVIGLSSFLFGIGLFYVIDKVLMNNPAKVVPKNTFRKKKTAWFLFIALFVHSFPEGMALGIVGITEAKTALIVALAIAIHKLPEGIIASAPFYHATNKRLRAFLLGAATAAPLLVGFFFADFLFGILPLAAIGAVLGLTAGIMTYIAVSELLPNIHPENECRWSPQATLAFISGIFVVVVLDLIFGFW